MAAFFKLSTGKDMFPPYEYLIAETRVIRLLNAQSTLLKRVYERKRGLNISYCCLMRQLAIVFLCVSLVPSRALKELRRYAGEIETTEQDR
jgi:hypothetical protein